MFSIRTHLLYVVVFINLSLTLEFPPNPCYIIDIKGTTAHKGLAQYEIENSTLATVQVYKGGFSMPVPRTLKKNATYDY